MRSTRRHVNTPGRHTTRRHRGGWLALALVALLVIVACGDTSEPLDDTTWRPTDLGGVPVLEASNAFVSFGADATLNGSTGCNSFSGGWSTDGGDGGIEILTGAMTLAACATDELQEQETAFLGALNAALFYERNGGSLTLLDGDKNKLAELAEASVDE